MILTPIKVLMVRAFSIIVFLSFPTLQLCAVSQHGSTKAIFGGSWSCADLLRLLTSAEQPLAEVAKKIKNFGRGGDQFGPVAISMYDPKKKKNYVTTGIIFELVDRSESLRKIKVRFAGGSLRSSRIAAQQLKSNGIQFEGIHPDEITFTDDGRSVEGKPTMQFKAVLPLTYTCPTGEVRAEHPTSRALRSQMRINSIPIETLEKRMRPGADSLGGFLGVDEGLNDIRARDNETVVKLGLTHQEIASFLYGVPIWGKQRDTQPRQFSFKGNNYEFLVLSYLGEQQSPFGDGKSTDSETWIKNLDNGHWLRISHLIPHFIETYSFYEGEGSAYRVDPEEIVNVFPQLKKK